MSNLMPWDCHPDLTEDRLRIMAQFFSNTRRELMTHYDKNKGDDAWSLGCRGFSWWKNRLAILAHKGTYTWLSVMNPSKRFIFGIGAVPVRFYRGKIERPPGGTLANNHDELRQISLAFPDKPDLRNLKWRFAIETNFLGQPSKVIFAGLTIDGFVECNYSVPFEADVIDFAPAKSPLESEVVLPAPVIRMPAPKTKDIDVG